MVEILYSEKVHLLSENTVCQQEQTGVTLRFGGVLQ